MAIDYTELAALAQELILESGRTVKVQKLSSAAADATKPWLGAGAQTVTTERSLPAVFVPASGGGLGRELVDEELLKRVQQVALIAPTDIDLESFNCIEDNGSKWRVEFVQVLRPANVTLLYVFGVMR